MKSLQARPITADELRRARQPMIEHSRNSLSTNGFCFQTLLAAAYRPSTVENALTIEADYNSVTPEMIQQLARRYLRPEKAYKASIVAEPEAADAKKS